MFLSFQSIFHPQDRGILQVGLILRNQESQLVTIYTLDGAEVVVYLKLCLPKLKFKNSEKLFNHRRPHQKNFVHSTLNILDMQGEKFLS